MEHNGTQGLRKNKVRDSEKKTLEIDLLQTCFVVENFGSNRPCIAIKMHGDSSYSKYGGILLWTDF